MTNQIKEGKNILLEGQLGSLKDPDHGIYPMVTSSSTLAAYGAIGAGSLALGGFVASTAYMLKMPIFIVIIAFIYFLEVLSVIIQVVLFKLTGKRVFRMAPIHHHFELGGWPESKVVAIFSIVTAVLCVVGLLAL